MKTIHKKHGIGRLVSFVLAFSMIFAMVPATVFADDTTQTIYIGGNELTVKTNEASYWKYNEGTGEIKACSEAEANVVINAEEKYDPASAIVVNLRNVKIYSNSGGKSEDCFNSGIYCPVNFLKLRINGDCSITGARYGVYVNQIRITPLDTDAKLTITGDNNRASIGTYFTEACALYSSGLIWFDPGCKHTDFSVILRSSTKTLKQGKGKFFYNGSTASILTSPNMLGGNATEYFPDENGDFNLGDTSQVMYMEYKVGSQVFDRAEITGATLQFNDGDAPAFTAQVAAGEKGKYLIDSEQWCELDENGNKVKWCSSNKNDNPQDESQLLKTFEAGKTYYYSVRIILSMMTVDSFTEKMPVIINGESFPVTNTQPISGDYMTVYATNIKSMTVPDRQVPEDIKTIDVTNATLTYHAGDAPKATAALSGENATKYKIVYEYWEEMEKQSDGTVVPVKFWYSDATKNAKLADDQKITAFEEGKNYTYCINLEAVDGNLFADVDTGLTMTLNGETVDASKITVDEGCDFVYAMELKTMQPTVAQSTYNFLEGENVSWTQGGNGTLRFRVNGEISKFTGVKVDGTLVSADNYTTQSGSTIITLKSGYLKDLSVGTHKITVIYTDGECSADFEIKRATGGTTTETTTKDRENTTEATTEGGKSSSEATTATATTESKAATNAPKTGDDRNPLVWIVLLAAACGGMTVVVRYKSKYPEKKM